MATLGQDDHPLYRDTQFDDAPADCHEQTANATGACVAEYSTALWGQLAVQASGTPAHPMLCPSHAAPPGALLPIARGTPLSVPNAWSR